jgi:hypothetical protein
MSDEVHFRHESPEAKADRKLILDLATAYWGAPEIYAADFKLATEVLVDVYHWQPAVYERIVRRLDADVLVVVALLTLVAEDRQVDFAGAAELIEHAIDEVIVRSRRRGEGTDPTG